MNVSNNFKSGETFWGFIAGTREKSNEQTVCIKEVNIGSETIPLLDPNNGVDCGVQIKSSNDWILLNLPPLMSPIFLGLVLVLRILISMVV